MRFSYQGTAHTRHSWDPGGGSGAPCSVSPSQERLSSTGPLRAASLWVWRPLGEASQWGDHFLFPRLLDIKSLAHGHIDTEDALASPHGKRMGRAGKQRVGFPAHGLDTHQCNLESRILAPTSQGNNVQGFHLFLGYLGPVPRRRPEERTCGF